MGNQNLVWETFVANVERCPIGYEIRRVFTQPGSVAAPQHSTIPAAAVECKAEVRTEFSATKMCMAASEV